MQSSGICHLASRIERGVMKTEMMISVIAINVILITVFVSIVFRLLKVPIPNLAEWAIVAMAPLTFVGAAMCTYLRRHISIDAVAGITNTRLREALSMVASFLVIVFCAYFFHVFSDFFSFVWRTGERLSELRTPIWFPGAFVLAGTALMAFHALYDLVESLMKVIRPEETVE